STAATSPGRERRPRTQRRRPATHEATPETPVLRSTRVRSGRGRRTVAAGGTLDVGRGDRQAVGPGAPGTVHGIVWRADHRLPVDVEAGVEDDADAPARAGLTQHVGERASRIVVDHLRTAGAVDADHTGEAAAETRRHLVGHRHGAVAIAGP